MSDLLLGVLIGLIVGWNFLPQPKWVANLWSKFFGWFK